MALATREHLVRAFTADLTRCAPSARHDAIVARVHKLLLVYAPSHVALVTLDAPAAVAPLQTRLQAELDGIREAWCFTLAEYDAHTIRRAHLTDDKTRPTNRAFMRCLSARFLELTDPTPPPSAAVPCVRRIFPTRREREAARLFLAIGGAFHHLEESLRHRLVS